LVEVEEKLPCVFGLEDDCKVRHFIRQAYMEQHVAMRIPAQKVGTQEVFPKELEALMQGMFGSFQKMFQSMTELQTLSNFCMACINKRTKTHFPQFKGETDRE